MEPMVADPFVATRDVHVIPTLWPVPEVGVLPMNAFLIRAAEPVLVDTGAGVLSDQFLDAVSSLLPLHQLRWIWLTHEDRGPHRQPEPAAGAGPAGDGDRGFLRHRPDGTGAVFPLDRLRVVTPGDRVSVGDRELVAVRPPLFDSPSTTGLIDDSTRVLFNPDCFGAPLPTLEQAGVTSIGELEPQVVARGQTSWATVDSPWVTSVDQRTFRESLDAVRRLEPTAILSSHLPPSHGQTEALLANLAAAPHAEPVQGTTQAQLEALLASWEPAGA